MALSNTATPKYYGEFKAAVMAGKIPVNEEVSLQMNLIDQLIANPGIYYDNEAIDGYIAFCENELTITDGSDLKLLESFKLWAEDVLSWFYFVEKDVYIPDPNGGTGTYEKKFVKRRLRHKQYLIVGRGAAKSMYGSTIQSYGLVCDTSTTHQIATAPTMKQSEEVISPIKTSIVRSRGPVFKFLTYGNIMANAGMKFMKASLVSTKKGVENLLTNSLLEIRAMSIDKLQGLRCKYATIDEWLSGDVREDVVGAIEQGASKINDYLIIAMSSEGVIRNATGDDIKMELLKILKGEYPNPHTSIWYYKLDDVKEIAHPELWRKANPNLGATVSYETYAADVERAENTPAARNDILAKRFGLPMEGWSYYFTYENTIPLDFPLDFRGLEGALGMDASQGDDFFAFTFIFPLGNQEFGIDVRSYITEKTLSYLPLAARIKYQSFIDEGSLVVMPGIILEPMVIYEDIHEYIWHKEYSIRTFGYDPYGATEFANRWRKEHGERSVEKVTQGEKTETVPLGQIKMLMDAKKILFNSQLLSYTLGNAITIESIKGTRKLLKKRSSEKIDNVSALVDAFVAMTRNPN